MTSPEERTAEAWLARARDDLWAAEAALGADPARLWLAVYHAHQCGEKAMKSLINRAGLIAPQTHNLVVLIDRAIAVGFKVGELRDSASRLNPYAVEPRYPREADYSEEQARQAVEDARAFLLHAEEEGA